MVLVLRRQSTRGRAREGRGPRSPGGGYVSPRRPTPRAPALKHRGLPSTCFLCCSLPRQHLWEVAGGLRLVASLPVI